MIKKSCCDQVNVYLVLILLGLLLLTWINFNPNMDK